MSKTRTWTALCVLLAVASGASASTPPFYGYYEANVIDYTEATFWNFDSWYADKGYIWQSNEQLEAWVQGAGDDSGYTPPGNSKGDASWGVFLVNQFSYDADEPHNAGSWPAAWDPTSDDKEMPGLSYGMDAKYFRVAKITDTWFNVEILATGLQVDMWFQDDAASPYNAGLDAGPSNRFSSDEFVGIGYEWTDATQTAVQVIDGAEKVLTLEASAMVAAPDLPTGTQESDFTSYSSVQVKFVNGAWKITGGTLDTYLSVKGVDTDSDGVLDNPWSESNLDGIGTWNDAFNQNYAPYGTGGYDAKMTIQYQSYDSSDPRLTQADMWDGKSRDPIIGFNPTPSALLLGGIGFAAVALLRRRRRA